MNLVELTKFSPTGKNLLLSMTIHNSRATLAA